jgi:hypothetical protein
MSYCNEVVLTLSYSSAVIDLLFRELACSTMRENENSSMHSLHLIFTGYTERNTSKHMLIMTCNFQTPGENKFTNCSTFLSKN